MGAKAAHGTLCPRGGGAQWHVGHSPLEDAETISLAGMDRIVEYSPSDMVVIAQSGMTVEALQTHLAEHGQWLPLEVAHPHRQTLGGVVATRAPSAVRAGYGSVRDWLIGLSAVAGDGQEVRGGGKVVKNVSGYDIPKLYCGSWGTLGVITQVAFKLAPLPEASKTLLAILSSDRNSEEALDALLAGVDPVATHLLNATAARQVLGDSAEDGQYLVIRLSGLTEDVNALTQQASSLVGPFAVSVLELPGAIAHPLNASIRDYALRDASLTVRYNILSSQVGAFARMIEWTANKSGFSAAVVADCRTGFVVSHGEPISDDSDWDEYYLRFRDKADRVGGSSVIERMPTAWKQHGVPIWSPVLPEFALMQEIKRKLDPSALFNRGRFVGGL